MTRRFRPTPPWAAVALLVVASAPAVAAPRPAQHTLEAIVTRVVDGDTVEVAVAGGPAALAVRLADIDAPEICQPWGTQSRAALAAFALNKAVAVRARGRDAQGRMLARVEADGVDLGRRMVEEGHAWSLRTRWDRGPLVKQERMARSLGRGLHAGGGAVMPADFRRSHGACAPARDDAASRR